MGEGRTAGADHSIGLKKVVGSAWLIGDAVIHISANGRFLHAKLIAVIGRIWPRHMRALNARVFCALLWATCLLFACQGQKVPVSGIDGASLQGRTVTVVSIDGPRVTGVVSWVTSDSIAVRELALAPAPATTHILAASQIASVTLQEGRQIPGYIFGIVLATVVILGTILALTLEDPTLR